MAGFSFKRNVYLPDASPSVTLLEDGRRIRLNHRFAFVDFEGRTWAALRGFEADGASIPRFFWRVIGPPLEGRYRNASIIHDYYCERREYPSWMVHRVFFNAMRTSGVHIFKAVLMYLAVRLYGPQFPRTRNTWKHYALTLNIPKLIYELRTPLSEVANG